jgi:hypothetical protein
LGIGTLYEAQIHEPIYQYTFRAASTGAIPRIITATNSNDKLTRSYFPALATAGSASFPDHVRGIRIEWRRLSVVPANHSSISLW